MESTENKAAIYSAQSYMFMLALHSYQSGPTKSCSLEREKTFLSCYKKILVNNQSYRRSLLLGLFTAFLLCFHKQAFESMKNNNRLMRQQNRNISKTKIVLQILLTFCHSFSLMLLLRIWLYIKDRINTRLLPRMKTGGSWGVCLRCWSRYERRGWRSLKVLLCYSTNGCVCILQKQQFHRNEIWINTVPHAPTFFSTALQCGAIRWLNVRLLAKWNVVWHGDEAKGSIMHCVIVLAL